MFFSNAMAYRAVSLVSLGILAHAQDYTSNLGTLAGLSGDEVKEKLAADPMLLMQFLDAADVDSVLSKATVGGSSCQSSTKTAIEITNVPRASYPSPKGTEFLGLGYNVLTGNPRGSLTSELDPGFRFPVLKFTKTLKKKTRGYGVFDGSHLTGSKMCTKSSEAKDISSTKDMQDTLNKESSQDTTITAGLEGFGATFNSENSFSKSEKLNQFKQNREASSSVSFETSAMCIDYKIEINPYEVLTLDEDFNQTIIELPEDYDKTNQATKAAYEKFLRVYGTHYITQLDVGGKMVITSEISSKDVTSLTRKTVTISSALSFDNQFKFGMGMTADEAEPWKVAKEDAPSRDKEIEFRKPICCGDGIKTPSKADIEDLFPKKPKETLKDALGIDIPAFSVSVGASTKHTTKSVRTTKNEDAVKSKITKTSMFTLGGLPPKDSKFSTWAESVAANPMPVAYKYKPIWELPEFSESKKNAYFAAVLDIYGVDLVGATESGEPAFRYGVCRSSGDAISRYSDDPDRHRRANLELELLPATEVNSDAIVVYTNKNEAEGVKNTWTSFVRASNVGYYACGLRAKYDPNWYLGDIYDDKGLSGLDVRFCSFDFWSNQEEKPIYRDIAGQLEPWKMCPVNQFIVQIKAMTRFGDHIDELGIETLKIKCASADGHSITSYTTDGFEDIVINSSHREGELSEAQPEKIIPGNLVSAIRVQYGGYDREQHGIKGMEIQVSAGTSTSGPKNPIYYYKSYWDLLTTTVSPIFATAIRGMVARNAFESDQLSFTNRKGQLILESAAHYTYMDDPTRPKIAVTDFKNDIDETDLPSFSFLVANDLSGKLGESGSVLAGIVHPDGYALSSFSQNAEFEVAVENKDEPNLMTILLDNVTDYDSIQLLVSPLWFPDIGSQFPTHAGDVTVSASNCERSNGGVWKCGVYVGTSGNIAAQNHLGFSFLAVGDKGSLNQDINVHGQVVMKGYAVDLPSSKLFNGVTASAQFSGAGQSFTVVAGAGDMAKIKINNQRTGGVLLSFDPPFEDIPSIIISPVVDASPTRQDVDIMTMPSTVVEHITPKEALIRVGMVNTESIGALKETHEYDVESIFEPITFNFFVIAPSRKRTAVEPTETATSVSHLSAQALVTELSDAEHDSNAMGSKTALAGFMKVNQSLRGGDLP